MSTLCQTEVQGPEGSLTQGSCSTDEAAVAGINRAIEENLREIAEARRKIDVLQRHIGSIEAKVDLQRQARSLLLKGEINGKAARQKRPDKPVKLGRVSTKPSLPVRTVTEDRAGSLASLVRTHASRILREAERPMNRLELLGLLQASGVEVPGRDPAKRVGKIMWGAKQFAHVGEGYWFAGEKIPSSVPT